MSIEVDNSADPIGILVSNDAEPIVVTVGGGTGPPGPQGPQGVAGTPGLGIPVGGTVTQVLTKQSSTDYDLAWANPVYIVAQPNQPTAADYGLTTMPPNAIWIQTI